jgi:disease resistance protein RPM1
MGHNQAIDDENSCGGRIIITTRNFEVATKAGEVYKLQRLPYDDSRKLFSTRIYGHEGRNCIDNQLDHISDKILRKCDGIPLAIITMASLLVGKEREEWSEIYKSIGFGLKDNKEAESTKIILSFSYYDLPSHLRSCLVYLSSFPEDSYISKDALIWKWIAEGFVHERQGIRLFEIGEGYFNDLINRSMIEAEESSHDGNIYGCRVHDMVLDFIRSVSYEENFLTMSDREDDDSQSTLKQNTVRRLAQQNRTMGLTRQANRVDMPKARSFIGYDCVIEKRVLLSSFKILRVLAIKNCKPKGGSPIRIEHLGHLRHLRYLSL